MDAFHVLHASVDGAEHHDVQARRAFPLSGRADYVSLIGADGKELALLVHPNKLDRQSRLCLGQALERMYFAARILRVDEITETMGVSQWKALTDRGYAVFEVSNRQTHIRALSGGRYRITDVDGNRFDILDVNRLDVRSRALIASEI